VDRLADDHALARRLGEKLSAVPGLEVNLRTVQTNIVRTKVSGLGVPAAKVVELLAKENVFVLAQQADTLRWLTHRHATAADVDQAAVVMSKVATGLKR
jgi:threonine aldolase